MKTKLIILALIAATFGIYALVTIDRRSDDAQIRSLVQSTTTAIEKRNFSGAVACISQDYKDQYGLNYDRLRMLIAQILRDERSYTAKAKITRLEVDGDSAKLNVDLSVNGEGNSNIAYSRNIYVILKKEDAKHLLFIPVKTWRVVSADNLGLELEY